MKTDVAVFESRTFGYLFYILKRLRSKCGWVCACLLIYMSVCLSVFLSFTPSICVSFCLPVGLCVFMCVCMSLHNSLCLCMCAFVSIAMVGAHLTLFSYSIPCCRPKSNILLITCQCCSYAILSL